MVPDQGSVLFTSGLLTFAIATPTTTVLGSSRAQISKFMELTEQQGNEIRKVCPYKLAGAAQDAWVAGHAAAMQKREEDFRETFESAELGRWQKAIYDLIVKVVPDNLIDGGECDSSDPLDFTLAEIGQALNYFTQEPSELQAQLDHLHAKDAVICKDNVSLRKELAAAKKMGNNLAEAVRRAYVNDSFKSGDYVFAKEALATYEASKNNF